MLIIILDTNESHVIIIVLFFRRERNDQQIDVPLVSGFATRGAIMDGGSAVFVSLGNE